MISYKVFGTARDNGCNGGKITHLLVKREYESETFSLSRVVEIIEADDANFWSYHYCGGKIDDVSKLSVEVIINQGEKCVRTSGKDAQQNNLFELPIYYFNSKRQEWLACLPDSP